MKGIACIPPTAVGTNAIFCLPDPLDGWRRISFDVREIELGFVAYNALFPPRSPEREVWPR